MASPPQWYVAQDTFVADLDDGGSVCVVKGSTWPARHEVVRRDGDRGHLFLPQDSGEPEPETPAKPSRAAKPAAAKPAAAKGA